MGSLAIIVQDQGCINQVSTLIMTEFENIMTMPYVVCFTNEPRPQFATLIFMPKYFLVHTIAGCSAHHIAIFLFKLLLGLAIKMLI